MPSDSRFVCHECGLDFVLNQDGTTNHLVEGSQGVSRIDYDADADHTAFSLEEDDFNSEIEPLTP